MVFLVMGWSTENIEEKKKTDRKKHWKMKRKKNEEYEESQITTIYIFGLQLYFARKYNLKKVVYTIKFYLQFVWMFNNSNNTPNLNT